MLPGEFCHTCAPTFGAIVDSFDFLFDGTTFYLLSRRIASLRLVCKPNLSETLIISSKDLVVLEARESRLCCVQQPTMATLQNDLIEVKRQTNHRSRTF